MGRRNMKGTHQMQEGIKRRVLVSLNVTSVFRHEMLLTLRREGRLVNRYSELERRIFACHTGDASSLCQSVFSETKGCLRHAMTSTSAASFAEDDKAKRVGKALLYEVQLVSYQEPRDVQLREILIISAAT